jgi:hypothetical protein
MDGDDGLETGRVVGAVNDLLVAIAVDVLEDTHFVVLLGKDAPLRLSGTSYRRKNLGHREPVGMLET